MFCFLNSLCTSGQTWSTSGQKWPYSLWLTLPWSLSSTSSWLTDITLIFITEVNFKREQGLRFQALLCPQWILHEAHSHVSPKSCCHSNLKMSTDPASFAPQLAKGLFMPFILVFSCISNFCFQQFALCFLDNAPLQLPDPSRWLGWRGRK